MGEGLDGGEVGLEAKYNALSDEDLGRTIAELNEQVQQLDRLRQLALEEAQSGTKAAGGATDTETWMYTVGEAIASSPSEPGPRDLNIREATADAMEPHPGADDLTYRLRVARGVMDARKQAAHAEPDHYDDGHNLGWGQSSGSDSVDTGHYDDGHSFGWPQKKVAVAGRELSVALIGGILAVLVAGLGIGIAATAGGGGGGTKKTAVTEPPLPSAPAASQNEIAAAGATFLVSNTAKLVSFAGSPGCKETMALTFSPYSGGPPPGTAVFKLTGPGEPSTMAEPWGAHGSTFDVSFPLTAGPQKWTVQLQSADGQVPANTNIYTLTDKTGTLGC